MQTITPEVYVKSANSLRKRNNGLAFD